MGTGLNVSAEMLTWAIARAGYDLHEFATKVPNVLKWIEGDKKPTFKQLEDFSKKVYLPFGYLFLPEPPKETLPIPFFRTNSAETAQVSINVYDTILLLQQRQDWLRVYLADNEFETLDFVGKYRNSNNVNKIVADIRRTLKMPDNWASHYNTWSEALENLISHIEDIGIVVVFNGIVGNNTSRLISVDECRGFVLVDDVAPFMFVNNSDGKAAQMFTIVHELAHIWTGQSAGFDFRKLTPADNPNEILCDKIAAEFLVPVTTFNNIWATNPNINELARFFKVSEIVVARRALDLGKITRSKFFEFYDEYKNREFKNKETKRTGGNFYATTRKRLGLTFSTHVNNAVKSGQLLYRDAYKLTGLKGDVFQTYFTKHL
ncbi:MAG TPA: ImmA/IrrE family metallo-endopeptidase [Salinivirgaceae bacterium]|nr:ImmA/IrrE family metallo-endopeptidase [Salinivirgaceae bacterium]HQA75486.1 ImmA/IrrE family metallo-endopeptidase [Salinivirgaceae bacterium]